MGFVLLEEKLEGRLLGLLPILLDELLRQPRHDESKSPLLKTASKCTAVLLE